MYSCGELLAQRSALDRPEVAILDSAACRDAAARSYRPKISKVRA